MGGLNIYNEGGGFKQTKYGDCRDSPPPIIYTTPSRSFTYLATSFLALQNLVDTGNQ